MSMNDDEFWESLQKAADDAQAPSRDELADAERLLGELDEDGAAEPLPEAFVESVVTEVTGEGREPRAQAKMHDLSSFRGLLAAAAALFVAPKFLLAASAVTAIAVSAVVLRHTTRSLPFQEAVAILIDEDQDAESRSTAQGRIYLDVIESIGILQDVANDDGMAAGVQRSLEAIRAALQDDQPFAPTAFGLQHQLLGNQTLASDGDLGARLASMDQLTNQIVYGIRALKAIAAAGRPPELMANVEAQLGRIRRLSGL